MEKDQDCRSNPSPDNWARCHLTLDLTFLLCVRSLPHAHLTHPGPCPATSSVSHLGRWVRTLLYPPLRLSDSHSGVKTRLRSPCFLWAGLIAPPLHLWLSPLSISSFILWTCELFKFMNHVLLSYIPCTHYRVWYKMCSVNVMNKKDDKTTYYV